MVFFIFDIARTDEDVDVEEARRTSCSAPATVSSIIAVWSFLRLQLEPSRVQAELLVALRDDQGISVSLPEREDLFSRTHHYGRTQKAKGFMGILINLDLAKETGTMEFMATQVLLGVDHTYRHDHTSTCSSGCVVVVAGNPHATQRRSR